jgi:predicted RNase H-like HicB family nuclease
MTAEYRVRAQRTRGWWAITVDDLPGVLSQARRRQDVEKMARDAIALYLDVPPDDVRLFVYEGEHEDRGAAVS